MSGFSAQWLALREPYDLRARNASVLEAVAAAFRNQAAVAVVDPTRRFRLESLPILIAGVPVSDLSRVDDDRKPRIARRGTRPQHPAHFRLELRNLSCR